LSRFFLGLVILLSLAPRASAEVFHSRESALKIAFPNADHVEARDLLLTPAEAAQVARQAGVEDGARLVTVYAGFRGGESLGWAFLDTHDVRTLPETLLVVLEPDGRVRGTHLLAFHEPLEYRPAERWLARFAGQALDRELAVGREVDGISGATITARAVTSAVRRLLAVWEVRLAPQLAGRSMP
jgi:transcriptional regulator of nitric oxide reductase